MTVKKEYRNSVRSRMLIRSAFVELLHEKPFEKITATDIINRSGLNRSTFYAHYPDVGGIIDEIMNEVVGIFRKSLADMDFSVFFGDPSPILCEMLDHLRENQELYRLLIKADMALNCIEQIKTILIQVVMDTLDVSTLELDEVSMKIRVRMALGSVIDIYHQWLAGEIDCSLEWLVNEVTSLVIIWAEGWNR